MEIFQLAFEVFSAFSISLFMFLVPTMLIYKKLFK